MERMGSLLNDPKSPRSTEARDQMMRALQAIQAAMERLQAANAGLDDSNNPKTDQGA